MTTRRAVLCCSAVGIASFGRSIGRALTVPGRTIDEFGAAGDGVTDDTAALNRALQWSAAAKQSVYGRANAVYRVTAAVEKAFLSPAGNDYYANAGIEFPDGASADFRGATVRVVGTVIGLSNTRSAGKGDRIHIANLHIDALQSRGTVAQFTGCVASSFRNITIANATENGLCFAALDRCTIDDVRAWNVNGNAIYLGGNTAWQLKHCAIGALQAWDVKDFGTLHQPGNPFLIGATDTTIASLAATNCGGGIKFTSNCRRIDCGSASFDGSATNRPRYGTRNSGVKVQGDSADQQARDICFGKVFVQNSTSWGLFGRFATNIVVDKYIGQNNGQVGNDADIECWVGSSVYIKSAVVTHPAQPAVHLAPGALDLKIDSLVVNEPAPAADTLLVQGGVLDVGVATIGAGGPPLRVGHGAEVGSHLRIRQLRSAAGLAAHALDLSPGA